MDRDKLIYLFLGILVIKNFYRIPFLGVDYLLSYSTDLSTEDSEEISDTVKKCMLLVLGGFSIINAIVLYRLWPDNLPRLENLANENPLDNNLPINRIENVANVSGPQNAIVKTEQENRVTTPETAPANQPRDNNQPSTSRYNPTIFSHPPISDSTHNHTTQREQEITKKKI